MSSKVIEQVRILLFNGEAIGMGFNSDTGLAVGTAVDFDGPTKEPSQEIRANAEIVESHEAMMDSINMSAELQGHYAFASANLKAQFSTRTTYNSISSFVVASTVVKSQIAHGHNFKITAPAQALLDSSRFEDFSRAFGDSFIRGHVTGGEIYAVMRITSLNTSTQKSLAATLLAEINGGRVGGSFEGEFTNANSDEKTGTEFVVTVYQNGGAGAGEISTSFSVQEIKDRLHNFPAGAQTNPSPYLIEVATYDTILIPVPAKEQQNDFLMALADADQQTLHFLQTRNDLEFAAGHPVFFDNPESAQDLQAAAGAYSRAVNAVIAHAVKLSRGQIDPPQFFDISQVSPPIVLPEFHS